MTPEELKAAVASQRNLIANFSRQGLAHDPRCLAAIDQLNVLEAGGLEFWKTVDVIRLAAEARRFLSYADVAEASGRIWKKVRRAMPRHLDQLCRWSHGKGWPLLSAIVVEKPHLKTGHLGEQALSGFIATARSLGVYRGGDGLGFLAAEQARVFDWAAREAGREP